MEKVTLKRSEVLDVYSALAELGKNNKLPFEVRQSVARTLRAFKSEVEETQESQKDILNEYAEIKEDGTYKTTENGNICFVPEGAEAYKTAHKSLMNEAVEVKVYPIGYGQLKKVEISANVESILLDIFIKDEEVKEDTKE